jgi:YegS/Rv2252/BmrU family lipid kinase
MANYDVVILAFRNISLTDPPRSLLTATIPVRGKPIIEWVIDAVRSSSRISSIIVVGPEDLDLLLCMRFVVKRFSTLSTTFQNLSKTDEASPVGAPKRRYILLPCETIFITAPVIDKIISMFEADPPDIAIPAILPERLGRFPSMAKSILRYEGKTLVPGTFVIAKNITFISSAFRKLIEFHKERDLVPGSGDPGLLIASMEEQKAIRSEIRFKFIVTEEISVAQFLQNQEDLNIALRALPKPYLPSFSKIKLIFNSNSGMDIPLPGFLKKTFSKFSQSKMSFSTFDECRRKIMFYLGELGIKAEAVEVKDTEHARNIARQCVKSHYDLVIISGGDGTINAIVNELVHSPTTLGIIPLGTVNVFAQSLEIPSELRAACQVIARGKTRTIDLGKANDRYFTSLAGIGFDAYVIRSVDSRLKRTIGIGAYVLSGIFNLFKYHFRTMRIKIDNQPVKRTGYLTIIGNSKYYGAKMLIYPKSKMDDGLLDIVIFKSHNFLKFFFYIWRLHKGNLIDLPHIEFFQGKHISIESHGNHLVHIDGELLGRTPVDITVVPSALRVVC